MQEKAYAVLDPQPPQLAGEWDQVVVVHPHEIVRFDQGTEGLGEMAVDPVVTDGERAVVGGQVDAVVEQRP